MAITEGTNAGFCAATPSVDPGGSAFAYANYQVSHKFTSPSGSNQVTELGLWQDATNNGASDYNTGIYSHDAGNDRPNALIASQNNGQAFTASTAGFYSYTGLSIAISASTVYWIGIALESQGNAPKLDRTNNASYKYDYISPVGSDPAYLDDPWGVSDGTGGRIFAVYAVYEAVGGAYTLAIDSGSISLSGTAVSTLADRTLPVASGSLSLTGTAVDLRADRTLPIASGAITLTGTAITLTYSALTNYTLAIDSGAISLSGTAISLLAARTIAASSGSISLTGTGIDLIYSGTVGYTLAIDSGSITLAGTAVDLLFGRKIPLASGQFFLNGTEIDFTKAMHLPVHDPNWINLKDSGAWAFTEQPNKWGYLNNPRWAIQPSPPVNYDGKEDEEPQITVPIIGNTWISNKIFSEGDSDRHIPCGHWHKRTIGGGAGSVTPFPSGRWVAAKPQFNTPYIYLYDILYQAIIKVDTSVNPPIVADRLELYNIHPLDYDKGWGVPGGQRGGYCINKNGTRMWYLFREVADSGDCELTEVNITGSTMVKVGSTIHADLMPLSTEYISGGCSDDTNTYWCTSLATGRILKFNNSDRSLEGDYAIGTVNKIEDIDINKSTGKIYWLHKHSVTTQVAQVRRDSNALTTPDVEFYWGYSLGYNWPNLIKVYTGGLDVVMTHCSYHPSYGHLIKWDLDFVLQNDFGNEQYLQNIFGVNSGGDRIFTMIHLNTGSMAMWLQCFNYSDLTYVSQVNVSYYTGQGGLPDMDWDRSSVSEKGITSDVIAIFRYHNTEKVNYAACYDASDALTFLCDEPLHEITVA